MLSTDANGATDSDTVSITVKSVNDAPLNTVPGAQTVNEDTALSIAGVSVNDVDGNMSTTQLSVGNGVLNVSLAGGATISAGANGSTTLTLSGTQAQINAALASLSYQGDPNFNGADTLTVLSTELPFAQAALLTQPLTGPQWLACLGLAVLTPVLIEGEKWIRRRRGRATATRYDVITAVNPSRVGPVASR